MTVDATSVTQPFWRRKVSELDAADAQKKAGSGGQQKDLPVCNLQARPDLTIFFLMMPPVRGSKQSLSRSRMSTENLVTIKLNGQWPGSTVLIVGVPIRHFPTTREQRPTFRRYSRSRGPEPEYLVFCEIGCVRTRVLAPAVRLQQTDE